MNTTSEISPKNSNTLVYQGMFAFVRERLAQRSDSEHQAALIRIVFALIVSGYLIVAMRMGVVTSAEHWHVAALIAFVVLYSIVITVAKPQEFNGKTVMLSSSMGIATYPESGRSVDELVARADAAMYESKRAGTNCFCLDGILQAESMAHQPGVGSVKRFSKPEHKLYS